MSGLELLPMMAIGGTVLQGAGRLISGAERASAAQFEAQQYRVAEDQARTAAIQDETKRREDLTSSIESIQAIRIGRGVGAGSPTGRAILDNAVSDTSDDILTSRANYLTKADLSRRAAYLSDRKAKTSLLQGFIGAGESAMSLGRSMGGR